MKALNCPQVNAFKVEEGRVQQMVLSINIVARQAHIILYHSCVNWCNTVNLSLLSLHFRKLVNSIECCELNMVICHKHHLIRITVHFT